MTMHSGILNERKAWLQTLTFLISRLEDPIEKSDISWSVFFKIVEEKRVGSLRPSQKNEVQKKTFSIPLFGTRASFVVSWLEIKEKKN